MKIWVRFASPKAVLPWNAPYKAACFAASKVVCASMEALSSTMRRAACTMVVLRDLLRTEEHGAPSWCHKVCLTKLRTHTSISLYRVKRGVPQRLTETTTGSAHYGFTMCRSSASIMLPCCSVAHCVGWGNAAKARCLYQDLQSCH